MLVLYESEELLPLGDINNRATDGVFIMFHRNSDDYPLAVKPDKWASYQNRGEIAEGVMVVDGGKILVVAPTEAALYWSSTEYSAAYAWRLTLGDGGADSTTKAASQNKVRPVSAFLR